MSEVSQRQLEANRQNAKLGGVKTEEGKAISRFNALKYGILSKEAVITKGDGKENRKEFVQLQQRLAEELKPVGVIEEALADRILCNYWRLRRSIVAERGEIRKLQDNLFLTRTIEKFEDVAFKEKFWSVYSYYERTNSFVGTKKMLDFLKSVEEEFNRMGHLSEETVKNLLQNLGGEEDSPALWMATFNTVARGDKTNEEEIKPTGGGPTQEQAKQVLKMMLDKEKERLILSYEMFKEKERLEDESALYAASLPDKDALDKIIRYEAALERSLFRSLHELQRLQALRLGEKPPASLAIDIDALNG